MPCPHSCSNTLVSSFQNVPPVTRRRLQPSDTLLHAKLFMAISGISILTDTFDTIAKVGKNSGYSGQGRGDGSNFSQEWCLASTQPGHCACARARSVPGPASDARHSPWALCFLVSSPCVLTRPSDLFLVLSPSGYFIPHFHLFFSFYPLSLLY